MRKGADTQLLRSLRLQSMNSTARLGGWKAIGRYLACTERTARRWEEQRQLPVHRIPGGSRQAVWADPAELDRWLAQVPAEVRAELQSDALAVDAHTAAGPAATTRSTGTATATTATATPAARRAPRWRSAAIVVLLLVIAAALLASLRTGAHAPLVQGPQPVTAYDGDPAARDLYSTGAFELSERTATSLAAAEKSFLQLTELYPERAPGWSGLSDVYVLQREFSGLSEDVVFPKALAAARRALALDPKSASAWLDMGFVAWWWKGDAETAFAAFEKALELAPNWSRAWHWYGTALEAHGEFARSLAMMAHAHALEPENRAIIADETLIRFDAGERVTALASLETHARLDPDFLSWHLYLVHAYLVLGRDLDFLRESMKVAELRDQPGRLAELVRVQERCRAGGHAAMLDALSEYESRRITAGSGYAIVAAQYRALAHDRAGMYKWLQVAQARGEPGLASMPYFLEFAEFNREPEFLAIAQRFQATRGHL
jgi:tetratricopeptide (TPR) repeat protein